MISVADVHNLNLCNKSIQGVGLLDPIHPMMHAVKEDKPM